LELSSIFPEIHGLESFKNGEVKLGFNGDLYPSAGASVVMTTSGDMVKYQSGARTRLGIGSANQLLQVKSSLPSWETVDLADTVLTTAGDVLFENATPELARLPKGSDADVLTLASGLPSWVAPSGGGGGSVEFLEKFTQSSSATYLECTLSSAYEYDSYDSLLIRYVLKPSITTGFQGLILQYANSGTTYHTSSYYNLLCYNQGATAVQANVYWSNNNCFVLFPDSGTVGGGIDNGQWVQGAISFNNQPVTGSTYRKPVHYWTLRSIGHELLTGMADHEDTVDQADLTSFRFAFCQDDATFPAGTFEVDADSTATFWGVKNS